MARARNIKPDFFKNDVLAQCKPHARLLFIGLWTMADREGRLLDRPVRIKGELFPYENLDIEALLCELAASNFILRYGDETKYIQILNFAKHQNPHVKEGASTIPAPDSHGASPADSLLLIPDSPSLIPDSKKENAPVGASFSDFWQAYPLKKAKGAAEKAWKQLRPGQDLLAKILTALQQQTAERKRLVTAGQFVPEWKHPATWLRGRCWEDEPVTVAGEPVRQTLQEIAKQKHAEELRFANVEVRKYELRSQMRGEPDDSFLARVKREVTDIITGKVA